MAAILVLAMVTGLHSCSNYNGSYRLVAAEIYGARIDWSNFENYHLESYKDFTVSIQKKIVSLSVDSKTYSEEVEIVDGKFSITALGSVTIDFTITDTELIGNFGSMNLIFSKQD